MNNSLMLAMLSDPGGTRLFVASIDQTLLPAAEVKASASTLYSLTGLYHFMLSHYGSHGFLPTLKPRLTALAPRLDNGGWLGLTVPASHRLYSQRRTGAPPRRCIPGCRFHCPGTPFEPHRSLLLTPLPGPAPG